MLLPYPPRSTHTQAFWVLLNLGGAVVAFVLCLAAGQARLIPWALLVIAAGAVFGLLRDGAAVFCYRAWNRLARMAARVCRAWFLILFRFLVRLVPGRSRMTWDDSGSGSWSEPGAEESARLHAPGSSWSELRGALRARGTEWWAATIPLVYLLSLLRAETVDDQPPSDTYTLF